MSILLWPWFSLHAILLGAVLAILGICYTMLSHSVVSDSLRPHGLGPTRLLYPWGFSRQEYWSGLPRSPPGNLPNLGMEPRSPALQVDSLPSEPPGKPKIRFRRHQTGFLLKHTTFKPLPLENISHNPYIGILFGGNARDYEPGRQYLRSSEKIVPSRQEMGSGYTQVCIKGDR